MDAGSKFVYRGYAGKAFDDFDEEDAGIDTNVIKIRYSDIRNTNGALTSQFVSCQGCQVILSHVSKLIDKKTYDEKIKENPLNALSDAEKAEVIQEEKKVNDDAGSFISDLKDEEKVWICEFCNFHNRLNSDVQIPIHSDIFYLIEKKSCKEDGEEKTKTTGDAVKEEVDDTSLIFCIDISGSMSDRHEGKNKTFITRIDAVKASILQQLDEMKQEYPHRKIGIVLFSHTVVMKGDCTSPEISVKTNILGDFDKLYSQSQDSIEKMLQKKLSESYLRLKKEINDIETGGSTALGPGLLCSLGLASNKPGSRIILCTDGLANQGVGSLDGNQEVALKFYEKIGDKAVELGISISVVTIKGTACKVEMLGPLTDRTNGMILRVDPANLDFSEITKENIVATNVQLKAHLHSGLSFKDEDKIYLSENGSIMAKEIGNVTKSNETLFRYAFKTKEELIQQKINLDKVEELPIQAHVIFTDLFGDKYLRVLTQVQKLSDDKDEIEKNARLDILDKMNVKRAADLALKGRMHEATHLNKNWGKKLATNKNIETKAELKNYQFSNMQMDGMFEEAQKILPQARKDDINTAFFAMKK